MTIENNQLRSYVGRIEQLEAEKKALSEDIRSVYAEAKMRGDFDTKILRKVVALRRMDADERREQEEQIEIYLSALGSLADTPLGQAAVKREFEREYVLKDAAWPPTGNNL